jgi:hypothetical protein
MIVASSKTATAVPTPSSWMNEIPEVANVPIATQNRSAAAGDPPCAPSVRDRLAVLEPVARLLDAREERSHSRWRAEGGGAEENGCVDSSRRAPAPLEHDPGSKAAPSVGTFMISDFGGSTGRERKISVQVVNARIASAHGRCAAKCLLVDEGGGLPSTSAGKLRAHRVDELLGDVRETSSRGRCRGARGRGHLPRRRTSAAPGAAGGLGNPTPAAGHS